MRSRWNLIPLLTLSLLAACTVPINTGLGAPKGAEPAATKDWERSTEVAADKVEQGQLDEAEKHLERARRAAAAAPAGDEYAASLMNLGHIHSAKGETANAITFYEQALAAREKSLGPDHLEVANTLNTLGASYAFVGRNDDAQKAFERALAIREQKLPKDDLLIGQSMNNLALLYAGKGEYERAEPLYKRSIEIIQASPEGTRGDLIRALDNYAALLEDDDREEEAASVRTRAAAEREQYRHFRDDLHPKQ